MTNLFENASALAPYVFRITDNGGESADRYTVTFTDGDYLGMSGAPSHPQGVSMSGEGIDVAFQAERVEDGREVDLALGDLPQHIVQHIIGRMNEGFRDFLESVESKTPPAVAVDRKSASLNEGIASSVGQGIYLAGDSYMIKMDNPADDLGPFATAREAILATLPDVHALSGPEYHSTLDVTRLEPSEEVAQAISALEAKVNGDDLSP